jgi:hypothetical protein
MALLPWPLVAILLLSLERPLLSLIGDDVLVGAQYD